MSNNHSLDNLSPSSKRLQRVTTNKDRLSNLPPEIISDILSCLPTTNAVRTSVLSRRWRYMWTSIYNIQIDDRNAGILRGPEDRFRTFVNQVLLRTSCDSSRRLRSFGLICDKVTCHPADLERWILGALMRNAEILNIGIRNLQVHDDGLLWCFSSSLRELRLAISCTVKFPSSNCFPNLKWLVLGASEEKASIKIMTTRETSSGRAVLVFPVLENLELWYCEWLGVNLVEIEAPELISFKSVCPLCRYEEKNSYEIKIRGPKLAIFESCGSICNYTLVRPAVTYVSLVHMLPRNLYAVRAVKVLKALRHLKSLKISGNTVKSIVRVEKVFPSLSEVKEVEVNHLCDMKDMMVLLKALPSLESLLMSVSNIYEELDHQALATIVPQPKNTMSNLKRLLIYGFYGTKRQYDVVKYFLENANNLQEITVCELRLPRTAMEKLEEIRHSISCVKPEGSACAVQVVELRICSSCWVRPAPTLIMGQGGKTKLTTTTSILGYQANSFSWWTR